MMWMLIVHLPLYHTGSPLTNTTCSRWIRDARPLLIFHFMSRLRLSRWPGKDGAVSSVKRFFAPIGLPEVSFPHSLTFPLLDIKSLLHEVTILPWLTSCQIRLAREGLILISEAELRGHKITGSTRSRSPSTQQRHHPNKTTYPPESLLCNAFKDPNPFFLFSCHILHFLVIVILPPCRAFHLSTPSASCLFTFLTPVA